MALVGRAGKHVYSMLDFSDQQTFISSWVAALDDITFNTIASMFNESSINGASVFTMNAYKALSQKTKELFGSDESLAVVFGKTVIYNIQKSVEKSEEIAF